MFAKVLIQVFPSVPQLTSLLYCSPGKCKAITVLSLLALPALLISLVLAIILCNHIVIRLAGGPTHTSIHTHIYSHALSYLASDQGFYGPFAVALPPSYMHNHSTRSPMWTLCSMNCWTSIGCSSQPFWMTSQT